MVQSSTNILKVFETILGGGKTYIKKDMARCGSMTTVTGLIPLEENRVGIHFDKNNSNCSLSAKQVENIN